MYDVIALGELLIDFYMSGKSEQGNDLFEACPGGAPCNVLAMLAKLGRRTAFIGKLGKDVFGYRLKSLIEGIGIDASGVMFDQKVNTTLAFVSTDDTGERSFAFYRNPGADMMLEKDDVDQALIKSGRLFHFGTLSTTHPGVRAATYAAVAFAKAGGALISFDPNLRPLLWEDLAQAKEQMIWGCANCDILKISDDEAEFLTGEKTPRAAAEAVKARFPGIKLLFVSCGSAGSHVLYRDIFVSEPAFTELNTIDTTGAGDTFCACCLDAVLSEGLEELDTEKLRRILRFGNAAAAIVTTRKGALLSMPDRIEVQELVYGESNIKKP